MITVNNKNYDETKLSDEGKVALQNIQVLNTDQNQLKIKFQHNEILLKYYMDVLTKNLHFHMGNRWNESKYVDSDPRNNMVESKKIIDCFKNLKKKLPVACATE